ncbi:hypothetical protein ACLOJK_012213 [Asimina triloba]
MPTTANSTTFPLSSSGFSLLEWWVARHLSINNVLPTTLLLLTSSVFLFTLRNLRFAKPNNLLPPGPAPWPLIGSLPAICRNKPAFRWILGMMEEMDTNIACIRLGNTHVIPVTCPKIACEFLKKQDAMFATRPVAMAPEYASRGYLTTITTPWGDQWKKMRRVVACELLHPTKLRGFLHKRTGEADNLLRYIHTQCCMNRNGHAVVDVREAAQHYCGNVIRKLIFNVRYFGAGREDGGPGLEEKEHVEALYTVLSLLYVFDVADYLPMLRCLDLEGHEKMMKRAIEVVNKYHDPIVDGRMMRWRSGGARAMRDPEDMLDMMILAKDGNENPSLSAEEIKAQITELMIATVDNPSNAVEWAIAEMIEQPSILKKAMEELDGVVGRERLVQESDIPRLNYVKACAREAFRLHPLAPFNVPHVSTADTNVAGYFIPKGSAVLLSRYGLGRNAKVWDEPLKYKPERHLMEAMGEVELTEPDLRFISFSTGRRGCMGVSLGSEMTIMLLARLLQGFHWSAPPGQHCIQLAESADDLFLAKRLQALAHPRLPPHLYSS